MPSPRRIVAAATVAHALVGTWIATSVTGPLLAIDDLAYLSMGRTLAGGGASPLGAQPPYGPLYPGLLAPGWFVGLDEPQMVVFAQVVNALLGAALVPVLYVLVRRLTTVSVGWAVVAAAIGASLPAGVLTATIVWTERLLPLLIALALLTLLRLRDRPSVRRGVDVALVAVALYATHPRTIVVVVVVVAGAMWFVARRGDRRPLVAVWVVSHAGVALAELARRGLSRSTFGADATYDGADLAERRGFEELFDMVLRGGGTLAYLALATAGLGVLGAMVLARDRDAAIVYGSIVVATVAVAGWFLVGVERADTFLHGRYIEVLAPLLVALGLIGAREMSARVSVAVATGAVVGAGLYGAWAGPGDNWARPRTPVMMLGTEVSGAPFGQAVFEPGAAAAVGVVAGLLVLAAARGRLWEPVFVVAVLVTMAVMSGVEAIDSLRDNNTVGQVQAAMAEIEVAQLVVDDRVASTLTGAMAWEVGLDRTTRDASDDATHVLLPVDAVPPTGATMAAEFPDGVLWEIG